MFVSLANKILNFTKLYETLISILSIDNKIVFASLTCSPGNYGLSIQFSGLSWLIKVHVCPFEKVSKVSELDVCKSQNKCAYH